MDSNSIKYPFYRVYDENGQYIYPEGSGFSYVQWIKDHPDSAEAASSTKVS